MIRDVGEAMGEAVMESMGRLFGRAQERRPLASDLLEAEDAYLVVFDAPGVRAEDVQVRYEGGTVHVRLDRYREHEADFDMRFPGRGLTLSGKRSLPPDAVVEADAATANLKPNGTLEVRVPKAEDAETSTDVPVEETSGGGTTDDETSGTNDDSTEAA